MRAPADPGEQPELPWVGLPLRRRQRPAFPSWPSLGVHSLPSLSPPSRSGWTDDCLSWALLRHLNGGAPCVLSEGPVLQPSHMSAERYPAESAPVLVPGCGFIPCVLYPRGCTRDQVIQPGADRSPSPVSGVHPVLCVGGRAPHSSTTPSVALSRAQVLCGLHWAGSWQGGAVEARRLMNPVCGKQTDSSAGSMGQDLGHRHDCPRLPCGLSDWQEDPGAGLGPGAGIAPVMQQPGCPLLWQTLPWVPRGRMLNGLKPCCIAFSPGQPRGPQLSTVTKRFLSCCSGLAAEHTSLLSL